MPKRIVLKEETSYIPSKIALKPDDREQQLGNLAMNVAEQQMRDGTASSQVITHFLKAVSARERYERERLIEENKLLRAKTEALQAAQDIKELYAEAMRVFKGYQGITDNDEGGDIL